MATIPLLAAFHGDFVVLLVPVEDTDTMQVVAEKVAHHVIGRRLPSRNASLIVCHQGRRVRPTISMAESGIGPMDYVEISYAE
jgi:toluene monooxygenase system protein B